MSRQLPRKQTGGRLLACLLTIPALTRSFTWGVRFASKMSKRTGTMLVLDTDHLGEFQKGSSDEARRLRGRLERASEPIATTIISVEEIMRGWLAAIHREKDPHRQISSYVRLQNLFGFFFSWQILPWDPTSADQFETLRDQKVRIPTMDLKIAS